MIRRFQRAHRRALVAGTASVALLAGGGMGAYAAGVNPFGTNNVGTQANGSVQLPDNQVVNPLGLRTKFTADVVGTAISPDGTKIAVQAGGEVTGASNINIVDASTGAVLQTFGGRNDTPPVYSPDGTALYVGTTTASGGSASGTGSISKYTVDPSTGLVTDPTAPVKLTLPSNKDFPFGLAVSPDGSTLYVALSASNSVGVINTATMTLATKIAVGQAPAAVAVVGDQLFVSNRGGRVPVAGDTTNNSAGTPIVFNPANGAATTGTVSVINTATNTVSDNINVGRSPASLTVHDGSVFVTNTNDDTVSIINAATHQVTQTFNVNPLPGSTEGSSPNSVTFASPNTLLVSVGGDNAIAQFLYRGPAFPVLYQGLIPTDWYPDQVSYDAAVGKVFVGNEYGIGTDGADQTHAMTGTLTSFAPPSYQTLGTLTGQVFANNGWDNLHPGNQGAGSGNSQGEQNAHGRGLPAIPTQLGQPSAIKHVFLIIKENRTYDQVLGDLGKGNGDPADTTYGATVTPNLHSLANTFTDFDNFYDPAQQSADGHNWIDQADANDYLAQNQAADWARSYPGGGPDDPLGIQNNGYIWNDVEAAGGSAAVYGENMDVTSGNVGTWQQYYADSQILEGQASGPLPVSETSGQWSASIPSMNAITDHNYPTFDTNIPDQYRVDVWQQDFQKQLATNSVPNLTVMWVMQDHTGGTPTPTAMVADNDLATGRIISDVSHSSVWKNSAVFVEEDDTQAGIDHVDGHRGPFFIASPYATRGVVNNTYYTQLNVDKTIEQILGAKPMNQMDEAAVPMYDAFTNTPNFTPYTVLPNQVPLTQGVSGLISLPPPVSSSTTASASATTSASTTASAATSGVAAMLAVPAVEKPVAAAWASWAKTVAQPALSGPHAQPDSVNPAQLDRYDWYTAKGWSTPYPGDKTILAPDQVPGRNLPTSFLGD
jgi:YVTN family beta-propeller protein